MSFLGGLVSGVLGIGSTFLGNHSAKEQAQDNTAWQERMSNTAVQRRVTDLKAAGMNPLLAVGSASSGASTPAGSTADIKHFDPSSLQALASARLVNAQAKAQEQENALSDVRAEKLKLENKLLSSNILSSNFVDELTKAQTLNQKADLLLKESQKKGLDMSFEQAKRNVQLLDIDLDLKRNGISLQNFGATDDALRSKGLDNLANIYLAGTQLYRLGRFLYDSIPSAKMVSNYDSDKFVSGFRKRR